MSSCFLLFFCGYVPFVPSCPHTNSLTNQTKLKSILMDLIWQLLSVPYLFSREYEKVLTRSQLYLYWAPRRRPPVVHPSPCVQSRDWGIWDLASFVSDFSKIGWRVPHKAKNVFCIKTDLGLPAVRTRIEPPVCPVQVMKTMKPTKYRV